MKSKILQLFLISIISMHASAQEGEYLQLVEKISIPNVTGRIDHMSMDLKNNRLFVCALGNNSLEIIDLKSHKDIFSIKGLDEPQGVLYIPDSNKVVVTNGGSGKCNVYDANSFQLINSIQLGNDADNIRYDANSNSLFIGYGNGAIGIIENSLLKKKISIELPGHPEAFVLDTSGNQMFVNIPPKQIGLISLKSWVVERFIDLKEASENFPMTLDEKNHKLFIACRKPARLIVFDTQQLKEVFQLDIDNDADDIFWDSLKQRLYVSCGSGFIDIIKSSSSNGYILLKRFPTESGARTSLFVPEAGYIYLAVPARSGHPAEIMVYKII